MMVRLFYILTALLAIALYNMPDNSSASVTAVPEITRLKKLYLNTVITDNGQSRSVIVSPADGEHQELALKIQKKILLASGVNVPITDDTIISEETLKSSNVIAIGNMATNRFIENLYRQWLVILDAKYPGKDGYVIRSLHNPHGSQHNVIFVGGSTLEGTRAATEEFANLIKPGKKIELGWLMKIKLGEGITLPFISEYARNWDVQSWQDSRRKLAGGKSAGYSPSTFFGWNQISIAGVLYYMTGVQNYLDCFKALAMPSPEKISQISLHSEAFQDPLDPLVKTDHYRSHLVDCIYDLIEESPGFSDQERLFITNKLLRHQLELDPDHSFSETNGSRHVLYHLLNIYTGSRYFSNSYPSQLWDRRLKNVQLGFESFIDNPTWGFDDTLYWVSTSLEPVFNYFLMSGADRFVKSGTASEMMKALELLYTGEDVDDASEYLSVGLLLEAAYLLRNPSYVTMAQRLNYDLSAFRIGQSYWPKNDKNTESTSFFTRGLAAYPLSRSYREQFAPWMRPEEGFQFLVYKGGKERLDDYFRLDGYYGNGRENYHLNSITLLRMFGGHKLLEGYDNQVNVWFNGQTDPIVARASAIRVSVSHTGTAYVRTLVPNMSNAVLERSILYLENEGLLVFDMITASKTGTFDIVRSWQPVGKIQTGVILPSSSFTSGELFVSVANSQITESLNGIAHEKIYNDLKTGDQVLLAAFLSSKKRPFTLHKLADNFYALKTFPHNPEVNRFVMIGNYSQGSMSITSKLTYMDTDRFISDGATRIVLGNMSLTSDNPVFLMGFGHENSFHLKTERECNLSITVGVQSQRMHFTPGEHVLSGFVHPRQFIAQANSLGNKAAGTQVVNAAAVSQPATPSKEWTPLWRKKVSGKISQIEATDFSEFSFYVGLKIDDGNRSELLAVTDDGSIKQLVSLNSELLTIQTPQTAEQAALFAFITGTKDDVLALYKSAGNLVWQKKSELDSSFRKGEIYNFPLFTDPRPPFNAHGIYALRIGRFWGKQDEEIVVGRPSTVEFRRIDGSLINRVPTRWGVNSSIAYLDKRGGGNRDRLLFVGKTLTGNPMLTGINEQHKNLSDSFFSQLAPGYTPMHAWLQRGLNNLEIADLNHDGIEEVIFSLSGHWNEVRVYSGADFSPLWMSYFGPDFKNSNFIRYLHCVDIGRKGRKEVMVATSLGWLKAFDARGNEVWRHRFYDEIKVVSWAEKAQSFVVGLKNGSLLVVDGKGRIVKKANLGSEIIRLSISGNIAVAGTVNSELTAFQI